MAVVRQLFDSLFAARACLDTYPHCQAEPVSTSHKEETLKHVPGDRENVSETLNRVQGDRGNVGQTLNRVERRRKPLPELPPTVFRAPSRWYGYGYAAQQ